MYQFLADIVLVAHFTFVVFVLGGGLLLLRWPRLIWLHVPALVWGLVIELTGWVCPLTPLENVLRAMAGLNIYQGDFVGRYLLALLYPAVLTPALQLILAGFVFVLNVIIYTMVIQLRRKARQANRDA